MAVHRRKYRIQVMPVAMWCPIWPLSLPEPSSNSISSTIRFNAVVMANAKRQPMDRIVFAILASPVHIVNTVSSRLCRHSFSCWLCQSLFDMTLSAYFIGGRFFSSKLRCETVRILPNAVRDAMPNVFFKIFALTNLRAIASIHFQI